MAGIYIHIPFCKSKCIYCDFCSITKLALSNDFLVALNHEFAFRKNEFQNETIETIYFGGGTPSLLKTSEIQSILEGINKNYAVAKNPEITIEVNPDDISFDYLKQLLKTGINRLSIGIQSFDDAILRFLGRRHNSNQAEQTIVNAIKAGFKNISTDIIFGIPGLTMAEITKCLDLFIKYKVQHISAYHLTYENGTKLYKLLDSEKIKLIDEDFSLEQFTTIENHLKSNDYVHYEISNYSLQGYESKHNTNYWNGIPYLGFGPSAHSYNNNIRSWNTNNLNTYISKICEGKLPSRKEKLTKKMQYNEFIMTSLRTCRGVDPEKLKEIFGIKHYNDFVVAIDKYIKSNHIAINNKNYILTSQGMFLSDGIISDLFKV
ncbi:MAG: hypothetical protein A2033_10915 [Bacteroidetes bacterium GWA2_31_9]|nr:MAG: hypothetical protein A2033_10915 [Bacteroidetes bacterium GWA2_31_9]